MCTATLQRWYIQIDNIYKTIVRNAQGQQISRYIALCFVFCCMKWCPNCLEVKHFVCLFCFVVHTNLQRSVASVEWIGIPKKNQYRVGHMGKVHMLVSIHYQSFVAILFLFPVSLC